MTLFTVCALNDKVLSNMTPKLFNLFRNRYWQIINIQMGKFQFGQISFTAVKFNKILCKPLSNLSYTIWDER